MENNNKSDKPVTIFGYSERGAISALAHDFARCKDAPMLICSFLERVTLLGNTADEKKISLTQITEAEILIEQSLSQFGDPDLLIMLKGENADQEEKYCIFIEAKVGTEQEKANTTKRTNPWSLKTDFESFKYLASRKPDIFREKAGKEESKHSQSNLFSQLYLKQLLVNNMEDKLTNDEMEKKLTNVVCPPVCWKRTRDGKTKGKKASQSEKTPGSRSIGTNPIVLQEVRKIRKYCGDKTKVFFVGLLPMSIETLDESLKEQGELSKFKTFINGPANTHEQIEHSVSQQFRKVNACRLKNWGFMTWQDVGDFIHKMNTCKATSGCFELTKSILARNDGQISDYLGELKPSLLQDERDAK